MNRVRQSVVAGGESGAFAIVAPTEPASEARVRVADAFINRFLDAEDAWRDEPVMQPAVPSAPASNIRDLGSVEREAASPSDLRSFLAAKLPAYMIPHSFVFIDALPLTANGKVDRSQLAQSVPTRAQTIALPRTDVERRLLALWEEVLPAGPIGICDDFFEVGGQSLLAVRLMARVAAEFGRDLPISVLFQARTVEEMARTLDQTTARHTSPLVTIKQASTAGATEPPLVLVHPSGGNVLCYAPLGRALGNDQPLLALQSQQAEGSHSVEDLAARYLEALRAVQPKGPYLLGGWSFGGLVAFEMARRVIASGEEVALLAMIDTWSPAKTPKLSDAGLLAAFLRDVGASREIDADFIERALRGAPAADDALDIVLAAARAAGLAVPSLEREEIRANFATYCQHIRAGYEYEPQRLPQHAVIVRATESLYDADGGRDLGWSTLTDSLEVHELEGDHFSILKASRVEALGAILERAIDTALQSVKE
jgi:thioesterase domain-containing protein